MTASVVRLLFDTATAPGARGASTATARRARSSAAQPRTSSDAHEVRPGHHLQPRVSGARGLGNPGRQVLELSVAKA